MKYLIALFISLCFLTACRDLQEKDIRKDNIELVSPADSLHSNFLNQTFFWSKLDGASSYRIQITYNNFGNGISLVLDSTVRTNQFTFSLPTGNKVYQWRVMPLNYGYEGVFSAPRTLTIDSASIGLQKVVLIAPAANAFVSASDQVFTWQPLYGALGYDLYIYRGDSLIVNKPQLQTLSSTEKLTKEGKYNWKVIAKDLTASSLENLGSFTLDLTPPSIGSFSTTPVQVSIAAKQDTINIGWVSSDALSGLSYHTLTVADSITKTPLSNYNALNIGNGNVQSYKILRPSTKGKYLWTIIAVDKAGQKSANTKSGAFTVIE